MENERNQCRVCDGQGKPSTGFVNIHNLQTTDLSREFEIGIKDCLKCSSCGHSWIPDGYKAPIELKVGDTIKVPNDIRTFKISYFINRKRCKVYQFEKDCMVMIKGVGTYKPSEITLVKNKSNQKQFKEFDYDLATSYLDKFDINGKKKFMTLIINELDKESLQFFKFMITDIIQNER